MPKPDSKTTAKPFIYGRSQAVKASRSGDNVILESIEPPPFDVRGWRAKIDTYLGIDFPEIERLRA